MNKKNYSLAYLASVAGTQLKGDPNTEISGIATLDQAKRGQISFLSNSRYKKYLASTSASAVILSPKDEEECPSSCLITNNPYAAYAKIAHLYVDLPLTAPGIHPTAIVGKNCNIADNASIGPYCVIDDEVVIGEQTIVGPHCHLGKGVHIGNNCRFWSNVNLYYGVKIGNNVQIHSGAVVGSDGFGMSKDQGVWLKVPQLGTVIVGDDVEIGSNTTIDRGAIGDTILEKGVKLDNQIQVGHNVVIGEYTAIAACTGISGSVKIGKHCLVSGMVGFTGHFEVVDNVVITGMTMVSKAITKPGIYSSGTAIESHEQWRKNAVRFRQLDSMAKKLNLLEQKINAMIGEN